MLGTLYIIAAPSGCGKTSLVRALLAQNDTLEVSISYTTRPQRPGEQHGSSYRFVEEAEFKSMIKNKDFLEYAEVFGHYYGTAHKWVEKSLAEGIDVVLEIDWQGAEQIRERFPDSIGIFILPPSLQALEERLRHRAQDNPTIIANRMRGAKEELRHYDEFEFLIVNDEFAKALSELQMIVHSRRLTREKQIPRLAALLKTLSED